MTEVLPAVRDDRDQLDRSLASVPEAVKFAEIIAPTHFVPGGLRGKPDQILAAIMLGRELGLGPMRALSWIVLVDGRPTLAAEAVRALVLSRGHELKVIEWTRTRCVLAGRRTDSNEWVEASFSMDDARAAGLAGKPPWKQYPQDMLLARATSRLGRLIFADVLGGLGTTEDYDELNGSTATASPPRAAVEGEADTASPQPTRRRRRTPEPPPPATAAVSDVETLPEADPSDPGEEARLDSILGEAREAEGLANERRLIADLEASGAKLVEEATAAAEQPETITDEQRAKLHALFGEKAVESRESKLAYCTRVAGREITTSNDLTVAEASAVIDALEAWDPESGADPFAGLPEPKPYDPATAPFPKGY